MVNIFQISREILLSIIEKNIPFSLAIKNTFRKQKIEKKDGHDVTALIGCELRHHIVFSHLTENTFKDFPLSSTIGVMFALSNLLFLKRFNQTEINEFAIECLKEFDPNFDSSIFTNLISNISDSSKLIPETLSVNSDEYLSFRFNTPLWIVKMWSKQFGKSICIKILKGNYRPTLTTVSVYPFLGNEVEILESNSDFAKTIVPGILSYSGKTPVRKTSFFENNAIFYERMATKVVIDSLNIDPIKGVAIYSSFSNNIYLDLISRFGKNFEIDIINNNAQSYFETKKTINDLGLKNINIYDESFNEIYTCVSNPVGTFFVLPRNSMLDLLRSTPDYFIKFKQSMLDDIIKEQNDTLENVNKRVETGGQIVYMVPTLSKKEGHLLILNFLKLHPSYSLIEEKQFYPFETLDSCLYYANLEKDNDD